MTPYPLLNLLIVFVAFWGVVLLVAFLPKQFWDAAKTSVKGIVAAVWVMLLVGLCVGLPLAGLYWLVRFIKWAWSD